MDHIIIAESIQKKIKEIDEIRREIKERGEQKAQAVSEYDKRITITLIELKNGRKFLLENQEIENPPVSIMEKIAKGLCWGEKLEMEKAEANYKSVISNLEAVVSENKFQLFEFKLYIAIFDNN